MRADAMEDPTMGRTADDPYFGDVATAAVSLRHAGQDFAYCLGRVMSSSDPLRDVYAVQWACFAVLVYERARRADLGGLEIVAAA